jgi:hypothetical protein
MLGFAVTEQTVAEGCREKEWWKRVMQDKQKVIKLIQDAFRETEHPGDAFLQGSQEGCEPAEVTSPFKGVTHWSEVDPAILDPNYTALSFFSEGGFRHFLAAFLIADLSGQLQTADPLFHLTNGFFDRVVQLPAGSRVYEKTIGKSALMNPRRYGAITSQDYARTKLSVFTREEAVAIVAYLEWKREQDDEFHRDEIDAALDGFWRRRAQEAPTQESLRQHIQAETEYMKDLRGT